MRSPANIDLAGGSDRIVVIAPMRSALRRGRGVAAQVAALPPATSTAVVSPDAAARSAIGRNVLDPARRAAAARAGRQQAAAAAQRVRATWLP
jgi:NTE family protein